MVESSVKTISQPVLNRLEPRLGQLDVFACRQLDKFQGSYHSTRETDSGDEALMMDPAGGLRRRAVTYPRTADSDCADAEPQPMAVAPSGNNSVAVAEQAPQRSRWQKILVEAGTAAGAGAAALSEEGMRSLKYCLEWLSVSNGHAINDHRSH